jgi:hypothetical protein
MFRHKNVIANIISPQIQIGDTTKSSNEVEPKIDTPIPPAIQQLIDKNNGTVVATNNISTSSTEQKNNDIKPEIKSGSYELSLSEKFSDKSVPIGKVGFDPQKLVLNDDIYARKYSLDQIISKDKNDQESFYNTLTINVQGKDYKIKIDKAEHKYVLPKADWHWNYRLYLGLDTGFNLKYRSITPAPSIGISFASYGKSKKIPDFTFGTVSLGVNDSRPIILINPVNWNIGNQGQPFMENLQIGPVFGIDISTNSFIGIGLKVGL